MAEDIFPFVLKNAEIEWAAIHVGYVAEPPRNCIWFTCYQILIAATRFLSRHPALGTDARVSGFDKVDDLHHLATLAPMGPGITKSHAFLGILSCAFCISLRFLDFETSEFSCSWGFFGARLPVPDPVPQCHVPRKPFATTHLHR